jgi:hypothetical protein
MPWMKVCDVLNDDILFYLRLIKSSLRVSHINIPKTKGLNACLTCRYNRVCV